MSYMLFMYLYIVDMLSFVFVFVFLNRHILSLCHIFAKRDRINSSLDKGGLMFTIIHRNASMLTTWLNSRNNRD